MLKRICGILILCLCCSSVFSATQDTLDFTLIVNKSGVTQFYFCEPENSAVRMTSLSFPLVTNASNPVGTSVGISWNLFPDGAYSDATQNLRLVLEAASNSYFSANLSVQDFMLLNQSESIGLNYDIAIQEGSYKSNLDFSPVGLSIPKEEIDVRIPASERRMTIFEGLVGTSGASGNVVLNLTLNPPMTSITNDDGTVSEVEQFMMNGEYIGYLMLRVETY